MAHQEQSPDAIAHKDRPSPDVERNCTDRNGPSDPDGKKQ